MKEMPYELLKDNKKKTLGKNEEDNMTIHNALPRKEYERVFMSKTAKEEYEEFSISNEELIDSGSPRFNAIVTSLKSLNPDYSSKNHERKFLHARLLKWRAKVKAIEEAKYLSTLYLDELIGNLKVYEIVLDNDGVTSKTTKEKVKSLALKDKVTRDQTSDDSDCQDESDEDIDEEESEAFNMLARNFRKFFRKGNQFGRRNQFGNGGNRFGKGRSNSFEDKGGESSKKKGAYYNVCFKCDALPDDWIVDSGCTKNMTRNRRLFTSYKAYDGGHVVFGSNLKGKVIGRGNINHDSITITNVEHVSGLAFNMINVSQFCDDDCVVSFTKVDYNISKNGRMLAKGHRRNGL
ncbi:retrovirus-related pol polyprotein from transposon TNT 1-94 [Tanacetum coccineum]